MESTSLSSSKETLVAFRIAAKDLEFFKRMAAEHYKRGDIKKPTLAALGKWNLYWTRNMLKDLEKARILTVEQQRQQRQQQQSENSHRAIEGGMPKIDDYEKSYRDYSFPSSQLQRPRVPYVNDMSLQNRDEYSKEDYNFNHDGKSITRPFFFELFPDWEQRITKTRSRTKGEQ